MSISVVCSQCGHVYELGDSLAGKKVRCKTCGTVSRVPGPAVGTATGEARVGNGAEIPRTASGNAAAAAVMPEPRPRRAVKPPVKSEPPSLRAEDLYDLDQGPRTEPAAAMPARSSHGLPTDEPAGFASRRKPSGSRRTSSNRVADWLTDPLVWNGAKVFAFGLVAFVLPLFGLILTIRRTGIGLPPEVQQGLGVLTMFVGLVLVLIGMIRNPGWSVGKAVAGGAIGLVVLGGGSLLIAGVRMSMAGRNQPVPGGGMMPPGAQGVLGVPAHPGGSPPGFGAAHSPADSVKITLSDGKIRPRTSPIGTSMPGVEITLDYHVEQGMAMGAKFNLVIKSQNGRGKLTTFHLSPSGTIAAESPNAFSQDGPFEVYVEAESFDGQNARIVSNTLTLQWTAAAPPQFPMGRQGPHPGQFPGAPAPGMPSPPMNPVPPGMPGNFPRPPGFGGRRFGRGGP